MVVSVQERLKAIAMQREKEFVKNSAILSLGTILPKLTSIITLPVITGCLSKADYGTYDIITILVSLFLPVATLQMQAAAFRFLITVRGNKEGQKKVISNIVLFTIPVCVISLFILFFFLKNIDIEIRVLILLYFFIDTILITTRQIARGLSKNIIYSISALINSILEMVLMMVLLRIMGGELKSAIIALIIPQTISLVYVVIHARIYKFVDIRMFSIGEIKELISYSWPMIPNSLSAWVMRASDRLVLASFMGVEANAIYAVANKLPNMFNIVQNTFSLAWQENAAISVNDDDAGDYYGKMFSNVFNVFVGIMALLIAFTPLLYRILIRGDYLESYNHMPILYIAALFATVSSYLGGIYVAHMKSKQIGISTTLAAATNLVINIVFVKTIGIYAASLSTLISYFWLAIYRMVDVQKIQKIKFDYRRIVVLTIFLVGMAIICFLRNTYFDIINMCVAVIVAVILNRSIINTLINQGKQKLKR